MSYSKSRYMVGLISFVAILVAASCLAIPVRAHAAEASQLSSWTRLSGSNAYGTMKAIVEKGWSSSDSVVIAAFDGYWDALSASSLAGQVGAPILLTGRDSLASETAAQIKRLGAKNAYVVGGTYWIPDKVVNELKKQGLSVTRVSGKTAAATSVQVAKKLTSSKRRVALVATDISYHDALAASPFSYAQRVPIFLTENGGKSLPSDALKALKDGGYDVAIVGGSSSVSAGVMNQIKNAGLSVERINGNNAYETAELFAKWSTSRGMSWSKVGVATVGTHYDALTGGALCGKLGGILLLGDDYSNTACVRITGDHKTSITSAYVFGGTSSVGAKTFTKLKWALRMTLPTDSQISNYRTDTRSPYVVCNPQFPDTTGFYEYSVDFMVDMQPRGMYLCIGNFGLDLSDLKKRYANAWTEYDGVSAYAGFQVLEDGSKVAIMSVWDTYVADANGNTSIIHAKRTYPDNPRVGQKFSGEGEGQQTIVDYDWKAGRTYRALIQCGTSGNLEFWVCDVAAGQWTKLVSYDLGYSNTYMTWICCFNENFLTQYASAMRTMELSNFRANSRDVGTWVSATSASMHRSYADWTGSYNFGSTDSCFWAIATGVPNLCTPPEDWTVYSVTKVATGQPY